MTARCFMHELDHLNGIVHTNRANKIHLERALRKKKELDRMVKNAEKRGLV
jgi:peptide deformylase